MTQNPKISATEFYITFPTFAVACKHLGITSKADHLEMIQRHALSSGTQQFRILGTYVFDEDHSKQCAIFPAQSCGFDMTTGTAVKEGKPVLLRDTREWDLVDRKFKSALYVGHRIPSEVGDPRRNPKLKQRSFHFRWIREKEPSTSNWSKEICRLTGVGGSIELVFPTIQVSGDVLCEEMSNMFTESFTSSATSDVMHA